MNKKTFALISATVLVLSCVIGGTLAWLFDITEPVTNTFTVGDIEITLVETTEDYKMVPGNYIAKDPKVTVTNETTEDCWLFVEVTASADASSYITWSVADGWKEYEDAKSSDGLTKVYYRKVGANDDTKEFSVLANDKVQVKDTVDAGMLEAVETDSDKVTLTFKAYAVQQDNVDTVEDAWNIVKNQ